MTTRPDTQLTRVTWGRIAGLQLAALALQGMNSVQSHADTTRFITAFTGSHHFVMDYLLEEILHQQPAHLQTFLLHTSILERLCGALCDAVLGEYAGSGQATLEMLEQANLFLIPLDNERRWYRYHHLFADVLQARLMKEQPDHLAALHRRASEWYEQHTLMSESIHHALAGGDFERAAELIERVRFEMRPYFHNPIWCGWVKALPDALVRSRPLLSVNYAWELLMIGELEAAEDHMKTAGQLLEHDAAFSTYDGVGDQELLQSLRAALALAWAFHAQVRGDVAGTIQHARHALTLIPKTDLHKLGITAGLLGTAYWANGDLEAAYQSMADGMANLQMDGNIVFAISGTSVLAELRLSQGRLREGIRLVERSMQLALAQGEPTMHGTANLHLGLSRLYWEQGDQAAASHHLAKSIELGEQAGTTDIKFHVCLAQARMKHGQGDLDGALDQLDQAERLYQRSPLPDVRPIAARRAHIWTAQGRLAESMKWAHQRGLSVDDELHFLREFEHITLARILIARYRSDGQEASIQDAIRLLDRLLDAAETGERAGSIIGIRIVQALAHHARGDIAAALIPLQQALALAEPEGFVRLFVDEGLPMAQLLAEASAQGMMPRYISTLLAAIRADEPMSKDTATSLIESLSQRELEVLRLIAQGHSNREIAERLYLALDTVKGHNRRIFDKLAVQKRIEAVTRARELGLL